MASGGIHLQSPVPTCSLHEEEELTILCLTCIKRVCEFCLKEEHFQHSWSAISRVIREVRKNSGEREEALQEILSNLRQAFSDSATDDDVMRINNVEERLHSIISEYAGKLRTRMRLGKSGRDLSTEINELERMISFFSHHVHEAHDNVIFEMEEAFLKTCNIHRESKEKPTLLPRFIEGDISEIAIADIFGTVQDVEKNDKDSKKEEYDHDEDDGASLKETKSTLAATFTRGEGSIVAIAPLSDKQAWIYKYYKHQSECVDVNGQESDVRKVGGFMEDFVVLGNSEFIFTLHGDQTIRRSLPSGKIQKICSTTPLYPSGICRAHGGGLLVCLVECNVPDITPDTRGKVLAMKLSGKVTKKYKRSVDVRQNCL